MAGHPIVAIGASAGGVTVLQEVAAGLPGSLPAAVFVVLHIWPQSESLLPHILSRSGPLPAEHAENGKAIEPGRIYVAPPDYHLRVEPGLMRLDRGPAENRHRPAIDALFRSAARAYGPGVVGVLLTGSDDDGAEGLGLIRDAGGVTIVQEPADSLFPRMPQAAIQNGAVDHVLRVAEIAGRVRSIVQEPAHRKRIHKIHEPSEELPAPVYSCPDCGGGMYEVSTNGSLRFRCRVGHVLSPESMVAAEDDQVERSLWAAVRSLEDQSAVLQRLAKPENGTNSVRKRYLQRAQENQRHAQIIREVLQRLQS